MLNYQNKSIGIDVADRSIELVEIQKERQGVVVKKWNRVNLEPGIVNKGLIEDEEKLRKSVVSLFEKAKPDAIRGRSVVFGIPETHVYTHV